MDKKTMSIVFAVAAMIILLNFMIKPLINRNAAVKIVQTVLTHWKTGDLPKVYDHWTIREAVPPIYDLTDFKILDKKYNKENKKLTAKITVSMDFRLDNVLPSGKTWLFKLEDTQYGWKIVDFYLEGLKVESGVQYDLRDKFGKEAPNEKLGL